jgi:hypothetical protein
LGNVWIFFWTLHRLYIYAKEDNNNNNNQAFYSQANWGSLEMKPHEQKKQGQNKSEKGGKQRAIKNQIEKREKAITR